MSFRTRFDRHQEVTPIEGESRTKRSFRDASDINNIVAKYRATGQLPELARRDPKYGDFSSIPSFQEAFDMVTHAQTVFAALPAEVRRECDNDPGVFLERVKDPEWAIKHKLALPPSAVPLEPSTGSQEPPKGGAATQPGGSPPSAKKAKSSTTEE